MMKVLSYGYVVAFFGIVSLPILGGILGWDPNVSINEKRDQVEKLEWSLDRSFTKEFEEYFNDNFAFRYWLVNSYNRFKVEVLGVSSNPKAVALGKHGFLFYTLKSDRIYNSYTHRNIATEQELETIYLQQLELKNALNDMGIKYVVGVFPNKHTIYSDKFPLLMNRQVVASNPSFTDQVVAYLSDRSFDFVDMRNSLVKAKNHKNSIYRKIDTHWNEYGAYIAYRDLCNQTQEVLGLKPFELSDFNVDWRVEYSGDLTDMLGVESIEGYFDSVPTFTCRRDIGMYEVLPRDTLPEGFDVTINEGSENNETALVFRDSYMEALTPFISAHYRKVIYVWNRTHSKEIIEEYKPDVVMSLHVERYLFDMN